MHCRLLVNWSQSFWWFVEGHQDGLFCRPSCRCWSPPPPCWTSPPPPQCLGGSHPSSLAERGPDRRLRKHCTLLVPVVFINILLYVLMSVMKSRDYDFGQKTPKRRFLDLWFFSPEDTSRYWDIKGERAYHSTKSHRKYKEAHLVTFCPVRVLKPN